MKIFSTIFLATALIASTSEAKEGFYVGADFLRAKAAHHWDADNPPANSIPKDRDSSSNNSGFGLSVGYKAAFNNKMYVAPEFFYDYLNSKSRDFFVAEGLEPASSQLRLRDRYGVKVNFGYEIMSKTNVFVNVGLARNSYQQNWDEAQRMLHSSKIAPIYGVGISYDFTANWAAKLSYDRQSFAVRYIDNGFRDKIKLDVIKAGVVYSF